MASEVDTNRLIGETSATIHMKSGKEYQGSIVRLEKDSICFVDRKTQDIWQFPVLDIYSIQTTDRLGGAIEGFFLGGLGGGTLAFALTSGMKTDGHGGGKGFVILGGVAFGSVIGVLFGIVNGHDYTFAFQDDSLKVGAGKSRDTVENPQKKEFNRRDHDLK